MSNCVVTMEWKRISQCQINSGKVDSLKNQGVSVEPEPDLADKEEKTAFRLLLKDIYCNPVIKTPLTDTVIQRKCCKPIFILKATVYSVRLKANWSLKFDRFRLDNLMNICLNVFRLAM